MLSHYAFSRLALPCAALVTLLLCAMPSSSQAFGLAGVGPRVGMVDPDGVEGTFTFGGGLDFQDEGTRFHLQPNILYWSEDDVSDVNPNFDVMYHFSPAGRVSPYAGAGIGLHFYDTDGPGDIDNEIGANLFGGVVFPTSGADLFIEGRAVLSDRDQLGVYSGVNFILGR